MVKKEYQRSGIRDQEDWRGLRIRHNGLPAHPEVTGSYRGWPRMLEWLQAFLERGVMEIEWKRFAPSRNSRSLAAFGMTNSVRLET
jgi:hypothetical protein